MVLLQLLKITDRFVIAYRAAGYACVAFRDATVMFRGNAHGFDVIRIKRRLKL